MQEPIITETSVSKVDVKILVAVVVLVFVSLYVVLTFNGNKDRGFFSYFGTTEDMSTTISPDESGAVRTDLGSDIATPLQTFISSSTPTEVADSYTLAYPHGDQSTVTYTKSGTVEAEAESVRNWLTENAWVVMSSSTSPEVASFYALHGSGDESVLNISITPAEVADTTQTTVTHFTKS